MVRTLLLAALLVVGTALAVHNHDSESFESNVANLDIEDATSMGQLGEIQDGGEDEEDRDQYPAKVDSDGIPNHYLPVDYDHVKEHVTSPRPHEVINMLEMPDDFDWRNVNGKSYVSIPRYTAECWLIPHICSDMRIHLQEPAHSKVLRCVLGFCEVIPRPAYCRTICA